MTVHSISKYELRPHLDISRLANGACPLAKGWACNVFDKGPSCSPSTSSHEPVPIPDVEELASELERYAFRKLCIFDDGDLVTVVGETSNVRYSSTVACVKVEPIGWLESIDIEQGLGGIEVPVLFLGKHVCPWKDGGHTPCLKLAGNIALTRSEEVRYSR